jgi:hypothetical protein
MEKNNGPILSIYGDSILYLSLQNTWILYQSECQQYFTIHYWIWYIIWNIFWSIISKMLGYNITPNASNIIQFVVGFSLFGIFSGVLIIIASIMYCKYRHSDIVIDE